jgi:hypothetical protein
MDRSILHRHSYPGQSLSKEHLQTALLHNMVPKIKVYPDDQWYTMFDFPLCSLYLSTLLANLNAREYARAGSSRGRSTTEHGSWDQTRTGTMGGSVHALGPISFAPGRTTQSEGVSTAKKK